jgi:hypothetical protein
VLGGDEAVDPAVKGQFLSLLFQKPELRLTMNPIDGMRRCSIPTT